MYFTIPYYTMLCYTAAPAAPPPGARRPRPGPSVSDPRRGPWSTARLLSRTMNNNNNNNNNDTDNDNNDSVLACTVNL